MGTKNEPGKFDCYANAEPDEPMFVLLGRDPMAGALVRAEPDEPMFVLLGRDPMAGALVREWARWREANGETPEVVKEARDCATMMDARATARGKHPVDHSYISLEDCAQELFRAMNLHGNIPELDLGAKRGLVRHLLQRAWNLGRMGVTGFESASTG